MSDLMASLDATELDLPAAPAPGAAWRALELKDSLAAALAAAGYDTPTPIQAQAIPALLAGRDLIGRAQTGTGKTAAFGLPLLQQLDRGQRKVQGLVLCPTRELALQVTEALERYGEGLGRFRVLTVYGGAPIHAQVARLESGVHIVVGTPGRVLDCVRRGALSLASVRHVVLDEADEMLRMGFLEDVETILASAPAERQTALFSATLPAAIARIASAFLRDPVTVAIESETRTVLRTDQRVVVVRAADKLTALTRILDVETTDAVLVFARTRLGCGDLVDGLRARGLSATALHGDMNQAQREDVVRQLRARQVKLVVATDVAARGLDVEGISHVINFDPPSEAEVYVHRIGRTGRAGRPGTSILLITPGERRLQTVLERYTGQPMRPMPVPTCAQLEVARTARFEARIDEALARTDLSPYRAVVDRVLAREGMDPAHLAAALAALASADQPLVVEGADLPDASEQLRAPRVAREHVRPGRPGRPTGGAHATQRGHFGRPGSGRPENGRPRTQRLFVSLGSSAGLRPQDLVGAIANEAGIPGRSIGAIDIRERISFLEVAAEHSALVLDRMGSFTLRGRKAAIVKARPETRTGW